MKNLYSKAKDRKPSWEHAVSRFSVVTPEVIDACQRDFFNGRPLGRSGEGLSPEKAQLIVVESLLADEVWNMPLESLLLPGHGIQWGSDFQRLAAYEMFYGLYLTLILEGHKPGKIYALQMAMLEEVANSPFLSPLVDYENVYWEMGLESLAYDKKEALFFYTQGLAHNLTYGSPEGIPLWLRDFASTFFQMKKKRKGLWIYAALIRARPQDIWNYNNLAHDCAQDGLALLGKQAAHRALAHIERYGDKEDLEKDLRYLLEELEIYRPKVPRRDRAAVEAAENALRTSFEAPDITDLQILARQLVPEVAQADVKRPLSPADYPLPDAEETYTRLSSPLESVALPVLDENLRPNDTCWCGSGRKYKHCHMPKQAKPKRRRRRKR
jgi:hypothetical protein